MTNRKIVFLIKIKSFFTLKKCFNYWKLFRCSVDISHLGLMAFIAGMRIAPIVAIIQHSLIAENNNSWKKKQQTSVCTRERYPAHLREQTQETVVLPAHATRRLGTDTTHWVAFFSRFLIVVHSRYCRNLKKNSQNELPRTCYGCYQTKVNGQDLRAKKQGVFRVDDSGMDRTNYYYSSMMIIVCSVTITARQYVGSPLQCWVPAQFTSAWEKYAEDYCFVYNTYWVKPDQEVPTSVEERISQQLIYYQWWTLFSTNKVKIRVPFIMALEAAFFYFPAMFWGQMSSKSGLNIVNIVEIAQKAESETVSCCFQSMFGFYCSSTFCLYSIIQLFYTRAFYLY